MSGDNRFKPRVQAIDIAGRTPPHNDDAEAAVLSAVLTESKAFDMVAEVLPSPDPFYIDANRRIYGAAIELNKKAQPVDIQTVAGHLRDQGTLQAIGGLAYLARLVDVTPAVAHVAAHARIVHDKWKVRQMIEAAQLIAAEGYTDHGEAKQYLERSEQAVYNVARTSTKNPASLLYDCVISSLNQYAQAMERGQLVTGVPTGFTKLDEMTTGMHPGELIIIAARPGMGKTAFVINVAVNVAAARMQQAPDAPELSEPDFTYGAMVFSLEMPKDQISNRILCSEARLNMQSFRKGALGGDGYDKLVEAANTISPYPLWIDDTPALSVLEMRARIRRQQAEFNRTDADGNLRRKIGVVIVDYLQLMSPGSKQHGSREQEIAEISRELKAMAKALQVPVIALSQLSRKVEERSNKRPQLSDLRESGSLEQDADVVQFIYRPDYYNPNDARAKGVAEIITAKQRNGPTGTAVLKYIDHCTRFDNLQPGESQYQPESD